MVVGLGLGCDRVLGWIFRCLMRCVVARVIVWYVAWFVGKFTFHGFVLWQGVVVDLWVTVWKGFGVCADVGWFGFGLVCGVIV